MEFIKSIESYYNSFNHTVLVFERAIRTKSGRDHMQVQCIAIPTSKTSVALEAFEAKSKQHQLTFHELEAGVAVEDQVLNMPGGPYQEYFYIEVPVDKGARKRLVYVQEDESSGGFPMQFGIEVSKSA
ncbi:hypothetical protein EON65_57615 [archaeon]|nr:MAG: hypothetical protein EON65_57615 [archaeon]